MMGEEKEVIEATIIDHYWDGERWWYLLLYPDGRQEWVAEEDIIGVAPPVPVPAPPVKPVERLVVGTEVILKTKERATIILEHVEEGTYDVMIVETGEIRTVKADDIESVVT